jgi:hypothetical protein
VTPPFAHGQRREVGRSGVSRVVGELDVSVAGTAGLSRVVGRRARNSRAVGGTGEFDGQVVKMARLAGMA